MPVPRRRPRLSVFHLSIATIAFLTARSETPLPGRPTRSCCSPPTTASSIRSPPSTCTMPWHRAESGAQALVIALNTPGGLDSSMRLIIKDITGATIPVVVYVSPSSGRAASAGVFITMAAHVAAMAPGTNIGAAHPVNMGGGEMDKTMKEKVENDSVAYIKSIAQQRGRNVAWAEDAVRKSVSITEREALKLNVIDVVAEDVQSLLKQLDGRKIPLPPARRC